MREASGRLEDWAQRKPDDIALVDDRGELSWAAWNHRADCLAAALSSCGIRSGDVVAVRFRNRIEWAILHGALSKLSCTMLGLNWRLTAPEVRYILNNSEARALFCDDGDPSLLEQALSGTGVILKASLRPAQGFHHFDYLLDTPGEALSSRQDPALIIYTSGTTGLPKGVLLNRQNQADNPDLREYLASVRGEGLTGSDRVLVTMPMHHAAGPSIVRSAISRGSTMIFLARFDAERALQLIERHKVTVWNGVPTMFKRMASLPLAVLDSYDLSSIRSLSVGAAPVTRELKQWITARFGDCLRENYGSTEAGMVTGLTPDMQKHKPGSSGLPFKHVEISIRDNEGKALPRGQVGEIWVRTPALVDRYLNSPPMDKDTMDEQGYFRMGDMGRLDAEGYLYITDRSKDMIISGGVNIYPAEIEAVLLRHPAVHDVAVIGLPDDEFGEQVKAFCEIKEGAMTSEAELLAFAEPLLASYKRPRSIEFVDELPRNTMGKILKRVLREPYWKGRERKV